MLGYVSLVSFALLGDVDENSLGADVARHRICAGWGLKVTVDRARGRSARIALDRDAILCAKEVRR